jgi:hypothetical protein
VSFAWSTTESAVIGFPTTSPRPKASCKHAHPRIQLTNNLDIVFNNLFELFLDPLALTLHLVSSSLNLPKARSSYDGPQAYSYRYRQRPQAVPGESTLESFAWYSSGDAHTKAVSFLFMPSTLSYKRLICWTSTRPLSKWHNLHRSQT